MFFARPTTSSSSEASAKSAELLLADRYSCCFCWNVVTGSFFIGVVGLAISMFFLLAMVLAHFSYNIVPAAIGLINYSFLIVAEFTRRPSFYLAFVVTNLCGILFYSALSVFLIVMLFEMPNWYTTFLRHHVIERSEMEYSFEACRALTALNLAFYVVGILGSAYATAVVWRAYRFRLERQGRTTG